MDGGSRNRGSGSIEVQRAPTIRVEFERLPPSGKLVWSSGGDRAPPGDRALRVLLGSGRGCTLHASALPPTVLLPLRGCLRLTDGENARMLERGQLFVAEAGQRLQVIGSTSALWIALVAPAAVWRQLIHETIEASIPEPILLPAVHPADRAIRRATADLAREALRSSGSGMEVVTAALVFTALLTDLQSGFDPHIERCPGRTLSQRRGVFLRLQRVYNLMESGSDFDLGVAGFARIANYSPCHFVRTFNAVYGATPHAVLVEQRLRRAMHLVGATSLSITEVARATGFEDRCAFARAFKRRFGRTASAVRQRGFA